MYFRVRRLLSGWISQATICEKARTYARSGLVEILHDRERLGQEAPAVLERRHQALRAHRLVARFQVLSLGQAHARVLVFQALVVERDAYAERRRGAEERIQLHGAAG